MYPTLTTVNASAIATGHRIGDTGDFGNVIYVGAQTSASSPSPLRRSRTTRSWAGSISFTAADYLNETSVMAAARKAGYSTAAIGKLGPIAIQMWPPRDGTGQPDHRRLHRLSWRPALAGRCRGGDQGGGSAGVCGGSGPERQSRTFEMAGVWVANVQQQDWFTAVATKVVLPRFRRPPSPSSWCSGTRDPTARSTIRATA